MNVSPVTTATKRCKFSSDSGRFAPTRWLLFCGFALMIAIAVGTALTIQQFRRNAIETGKQGLENAVLLLSRHFDQQLGDLAAAQNEVVAELEDKLNSRPGAFKSEMATLAVHELLRARVGRSQDSVGVDLFDSAGLLINSSEQWPSLNVAIGEKSYFRRFVEDETIAQVIDIAPSPSSPLKSVVFARKILGRKGELLGILNLTIKQDFLEGFFASVRLGPDATIAMHRREGTLLARYPHVEAMLGQNFRSGPIEQRAVFETDSFTGQLNSPMDGRDRLVASRILTTVPIVIVATATVNSTLTTWRAQTTFFISIAILSMLVTALILYLLLRQIKGHHRASRQQLDIEKQRLDTAISNMNQGLLLFDLDERLVVCNRKYVEMYVLSADVVKPGCSLRDLLTHRKQVGSFLGDVEGYRNNVIRNNGFPTTRVVNISDGRVIQVKSEPVPEGGWLATHEDVTERIRAEEQIAHLAHFDSLTGLPNRTAFQRHVQLLLSKTPGNRFAILYIDIDQFKSINDSLGHHIGDELLKRVASRMNECVGPDNIVARLGGDEFAIVKGDLIGVEDLESFVERIFRAIRDPIDCFGQHLAADASIGIALAPDDGSSLDELLRNADLAMYDAKAGGRSTFRFFVREMAMRVRARRALEADLRRAIVVGEFDIHYQPLLDLGTDVVTGCEALLRWNHPVRGNISPAEFIPLAEETGLITELGEWVLNEACKEAINWPEHVVLAVNVSPVQFASKSLGMKVASALGRSGLSARRLELEITEAVLIRDDEQALATIHELRQLGVGISLDDFGTGYSSLSYLQRFPFDKIKIDRSFVNDLSEPGGSAPIVQAIITMAIARRMSTTAEGVESEAQRTILRKLGCTQMQGFLFSPAVRPERLSTMLRHRETATNSPCA